MAMLLPRRIPSQRAVIGAFTPSDPLDERRRKRTEKIVRLLRSLDTEVVFAAHAFDSNGAFAASPTVRSADIAALAKNQSIHALMATCGGKSGNQLLDLLDYEVLKEARKPIIGFSDIGVILNAVTARTGLITFYGPNVLSKLDESDDPSLTMLRSSSLQCPVSSEFAMPLLPGSAEGHLLGGNLSTFTVSVAGTAFEPVFRHSILFWEAGSRDWRLIEQYLGALMLRGTLKRIAGILIGKIGTEFYLGEDGKQFLLERLAPLGIPVLYNPCFGHGAAKNPALPIGGRVRIEGRSLHFCDPLVE